MTTQKYMGKGQLVDRLAAQVGSKGLAENILRKRGQMEEGSSKLTQAGAARDAMTAEERAKDRASKRSGKPASSFKYDPKNNMATMKKMKRM